MSSIAYVGLDVHKSSISVAMLLPGTKEPVEWQMKNEDEKGLRRLARKVRKEAKGFEIQSCYEAGPCGYAPQRVLRSLDVNCEVVAPTLIPVKPGERIKTDRRDALKLAQHLRSETLTFVEPPSPADEALRDLCRAREDAKDALMRSRHQLGKFLLRSGRQYSRGKTNWTAAHYGWLRELSFDDDNARRTFDSYVLAEQHGKQRVESLDSALAAAAQEEPYAPAVAALRCFRGIDTVTAMVIVAELHGFARFESPRALMAYLGIVPSEQSSGGKRRQGAITKTGNGHVRRVLVEAAWHYRHKPAVGKKLAARREGQPGWVVGVADKAAQRLHKRYWSLLNRGKSPNKCTTAVARELVGFIWAVLYPMAAKAAS